jgi:hypothetical protein
MVLVRLKRRTLWACAVFLDRIGKRPRVRSVERREVWRAIDLLLVQIQGVRDAKRASLKELDGVLSDCERVVSLLLADQILSPAEDLTLRAASVALSKIATAWPQHVPPPIEGVVASGPVCASDEADAWADDDLDDPYVDDRFFKEA